MICIKINGVIYLGMVLVIDLEKVRKVDILTAMCVLVIIGQWHNKLTYLNAPEEIRKIQRATGDAFLKNYFTFKNVGVELFHEDPHGLGLYDLVREFGELLICQLPYSGRERSLDMPKGINYLIKN